MLKPLIPLALLAAPALADPMPSSPVALAGTELDVSATGTVTRAPDLATIGAGVVTQSTRAADALAANARRMTDTIAAVKRAGIAERDIRTQSISLQPQYRYGDNQPPVLTGYQASNWIEVKLRDLPQAGAVIDALVAAGANQIDGPNLTIDHPDAALDEARAQAIAKARARADLYAKAAGLSVGRIVRISEENAAPPIVRPMPMMAMAKAASTPIETGEQELSITLTVVFELR